MRVGVCNNYVHVSRRNSTENVGKARDSVIGIGVTIDSRNTFKSDTRACCGINIFAYVVTSWTFRRYSMSTIFVLTTTRRKHNNDRISRSDDVTREAIYERENNKK